MPEFRNKVPHDYIDVLAQGLPLVGGQAVNIWAAFYDERVSELASLRPFTSFDIDVLLAGAEAAKTAARLGWTFKAKKLWEFSSLEGYLITPDGRKIEIVGSVYGLSAKEARDHLMRVQIRGITCVILSPTALLKGKLANATKIPQNGIEPRQDVKHVKMLFLCLQLYFLDMLGACASGEVTENAMLKELGYFRDTMNGKSARAYGVTQKDCDVIPWKQLEKIKKPKLQRFAANRSNLFPAFYRE